MPLRSKAVHIGLFILVIALVGLALTGCGPGKVVEEFKQEEVKVEPYTPEAEWNQNSDSFLTSIQTLKQGAGQAVGQAPPGTTVTTGTGTTVTVPGYTPGVTPVPTSPPPTIIPPQQRVPSSSDPIYGIVRDRIEGGVIPNALVTLNDRRDIMVASIVTNTNGEYSFVDVIPGYYYVKAEALGYDPIPFGTRYFYYITGTVRMDLELAYERPANDMDGGDFTVYGQFGGTDLSTGLPIWYGPPADVMKADFYSGATQMTYDAAVFDEFGAVGSGRQGWVEYDFLVPAPQQNSYSYDGQWFKNPIKFKVDSDTNVWTSGGNFIAYYYSWYTGLWNNMGSSEAAGFVWMYWDAINPTTGQVSIRQIAADENPYVVGISRIEYDYHKDTTTPTLTDMYAENVAPGQIRIAVQAPENCWMMMSVTGPTNFNFSWPIDILNGIHYFTFGTTGPLPSGNYNYSIQLSDQAGHMSGVYSGYTFTIP